MARNPFQITTAIAQAAAQISVSDNNINRASKNYDSAPNLENTPLQDIPEIVSRLTRLLPQHKVIFNGKMSILTDQIHFLFNSVIPPTILV